MDALLYPTSDEAPSKTRTGLMCESWNGRLTGVQRTFFVLKASFPRRSVVGFKQLP